MVEVWLWSQKQDIGPSPRGHQAMTYHSQKQITLLFGGKMVTFAELNSQVDKLVKKYDNAISNVSSTLTSKSNELQQNLTLLTGPDGTLAKLNNTLGKLQTDKANYVKQYDDLIKRENDLSKKN